MPRDVRELAKKYTTEAIDRLAKWMRDDNPKASVTASMALLDRGWGKPPADMELPHGDLQEVEWTGIRLTKRYGLTKQDLSSQSSTIEHSGGQSLSPTGELAKQSHALLTSSSKPASKPDSD